MRTFIKGFGIGLLIGILITIGRVIIAVLFHSEEPVGFTSTLLLSCGLISGFVAVLIRKLGFKIPFIEKIREERKKKEIAPIIKKRSIGVIIIGVICILYSIGIIALRLQRYIIAIKNAPKPQLILFLLLMILLDIGFLIGGVGILRLKIWARKLVLWITSLEIPISVMGGMGIAKGVKILANSGHPAYQKLKDISLSDLTIVFLLSSALPLIIFYLVIIYFLTRPKVKEQFSNT